MSREAMPKQLVPLVGGRSLLGITMDRLKGLVRPANRYVCAGERHRAAILAALPGMDAGQFLGEPTGRDTLSAIGLGAALIAARDPDAVMGVFPADHLIEPVGRFCKTVREAFALAEERPQALVTFGIAPTHAATGYGYLELGERVGGGARRVVEFKEKPDAATARRYVEAGPRRYLWNSGMFVWRAATLLDCIHRYEPEVWEGLARIARAWPTAARQRVLRRIYPTLKRTSIDFAVMERAAVDPAVEVAAIPMRLAWLDVGSWAAYAKTCRRDPSANALAAARHLVEKSAGCLVVSTDPKHLVALMGCEDLIVIHTGDVTLVCRADMAEGIKGLRQQAGTRFGEEYV